MLCSDRLFWSSMSKVQILDRARLEFIQPTMDLNLLAILPSFLNDVSVDHILDLPLHRLPDLMGLPQFAVSKGERRGL